LKSVSVCSKNRIPTNSIILFVRRYRYLFIAEHLPDVVKLASGDRPGSEVARRRPPLSKPVHRKHSAACALTGMTNFTATTDCQSSPVHITRIELNPSCEHVQTIGHGHIAPTVVCEPCGLIQQPGRNFLPKSGGTLPLPFLPITPSFPFRSRASRYGGVL